MSNPNINFSSLDGRYSQPTSVDAKIAAQALTDAGRYGRRSGNTAVVYGDSYAAMTFASAGTLGSYGYIPYYVSNAIFPWVNAFLGQRLALVKNAGITGETTTQYLARFDSDVAPYAPAFLFVMSPGINDVGSNLTLSTTTTNLTAVFDKAAALGSHVVTITMPPKNAPSWNAAQLTTAHGISQWLRLQALSRPGLTVVDSLPVLGTGASDGGWINPNNSNPTDITADGTHPALRGAARVGKAIADAIRPLVPAQSVLGWGESDPFNLAYKPGILASGGTVLDGATGTVANGWYVRNSTSGTMSGTVTASLAPSTEVDATDIYGGQWQKVVLGGTPAIPRININIGGTPLTSIQVGDVLQGQAEVAVGADVASLTNFGLRCGFYNSSFTNVYGIGLNQGLASTWPNELGMIKLTLRTPPITVLSGMTGAYLDFVFGGGTGTFYFRRPYMTRNQPIGA